MAPDSSDVTRLLAEAARATTLKDQQYFVDEAETARARITAEASAGNGIDLAQAVVADTLTPIPVHEHHTASTDWLGDVETAGADQHTATREMTAEASVWFGSKSDEVKADSDEFAQQAFGAARKIAGRYGPHADAAERAFLDAVGRMHHQAVSTGQVKLAFNNGESVADTWQQPAEGLQNGLPGERTTSERSPAMQDLEDNHAGGSVSDTSWPDPMQLPQADVDSQNGDTGQRKADTNHYQASRRTAGQDNVHGRDIPDETPGEGVGGGFSHYPDVDNPQEIQRSLRQMPLDEVRKNHDRLVDQGHGEHGLTKLLRDHLYLHDQGFGFIATTRKEGSMPHYTAACPECSGCQACGGLHRVAVSGLDQIDQTVDPHDNGPAPTPYPTENAFPWEMPADSGQAIQETEQQLKQREQLKGASRHQAAIRQARAAAERAYLRTMGGQDDSGWLGDMGAGGVRPGYQDGGNPGTTYPGNLADPDPVYGYGGDNPNQPNLPYGHDEANDYTNNPGMNYQPGQPTQYDQAGRGNQVGGAGGGQATSRLRTDDPEVVKALRFAQARSQHLNGR